MGIKTLIISLIGLCLWGTTISTSQVDNSRNNANLTETVLTPSNVSSLHLIGSYTVDGAVWGQPLYIENVTISGTVYNILVVCTMHDSCYAFDGARPNTAALWHAGPLATSRTSYPDAGGHINYGQEIGCLATPVVDVPNSMLYTVCGNSTPTWVLYKINLTTGATVSSVTITGSVSGTGDPGGGDCVVGGVLSFCPGFALIRVGLALANNNVYVAASSYGDAPPFHGWIFAYATSNLAQVGIFCSAPNSRGASFWQAGGAPAVDGSGNLYITTGNGTWDGTVAFGESILKFGPTLTLLDFFTPSNWSALSTADSDLSSGRAMLIPNTTQVAFGAKDFNVYSIDTTCMGHLQGSSGCTAPQIFVTNPSGAAGDNGIYGGIFANGVGYFPNVGAKIYSFSITGSTWNTTVRAGSSNAYGFPGAQMMYSSNGALNGILWAMTTNGNSESAPQDGILRALNPTDLSEYWDSNQAAGDVLGTLSKFASPTVVNGNVFAPTLNNRVQVYGLSAGPVNKGGSSGGHMDSRSSRNRLR